MKKLLVVLVCFIVVLTGYWLLTREKGGTGEVSVRMIMWSSSEYEVEKKKGKCLTLGIYDKDLKRKDVKAVRFCWPPDTCPEPFPLPIYDIPFGDDIVLTLELSDKNYIDSRGKEGESTILTYFLEHPERDVDPTDVKNAKVITLTPDRPAISDIDFVIKGKGFLP